MSIQLNHKQINTKFNRICTDLYTIKQNEFSDDELEYHDMLIAMMICKYVLSLSILYLYYSVANQQFAMSGRTYFGKLGT